MLIETILLRMNLTGAKLNGTNLN
ncbi:hypothetical protein [Planktothrix mougeotii]|uniref:Pentapeptide repeat-containing protein n=1 Tax=Planktothrix mougeotii LEGE 06226 TaxID=1828728 RepID=A0ABR9UER5_9CYAN|nr:hypothetical protein [Planktothrix mougeotii LEGE 06226]